MKRAFFVVGPESSGTKMMRKALQLSGCYANEPAWDNVRADGSHDFYVASDLIVFHRSLPHNFIWPDLRALRTAMSDAGYTVQPILMVRDWNATVRSQTRRTNIPTTVDEAEANIRRAIKTVAADLPDFILVTYEAFCLNPAFRRWLFTERLNLPESPIDIWYANGQYYEGDE